MTFREFLNQKDHKIKQLANPSLSGFQVAHSYVKDIPKLDLPDPTANPESLSMPSPTPLMGGRSFTKRLKTTPTKPSQFLPRGNNIKLNPLGQKIK